MEHSYPVIRVTIIHAMPLKVSVSLRISGKREEEGRSVQAMLLPELRKLFWSCLLAKNRDSGIARHQLDKNRYERNDGPHDQKKNGQAS